MKTRSFLSLFLAAAFVVGASTVGSVHASASASTTKPAAVATATPSPSPSPTATPVAAAKLPTRPGTIGVCSFSPLLANVCKAVLTVFGGVPN